MGESLDGAARSEVGASDAYHDHEVDLLGGPLVAYGLAVPDQGLGDVDGQGLPAEEVVAGAVFIAENVIGCESLLHILLIICGLDECVAARNVDFYHIVVIMLSSDILQNYLYFHKISSNFL